MVEVILLSGVAVNTIGVFKPAFVYIGVLFGAKPLICTECKIPGFMFPERRYEY